MRRWPGMTIDETTNCGASARLCCSDPNFDYFNGSIAANQFGDVVIGFTRSGTDAAGNLSTFAAVGHTTGGVTTFADPLLLKAGLVGNYNYFNGRWGDFTTTVVDPSNPYSFWTFQQYADGTNSWATQVTQILVPEPEGLILATAALAALLGIARRRPSSPRFSGDITSPWRAKNTTAKICCVRPRRWSSGCS